MPRELQRYFPLPLTNDDVIVPRKVRSVLGTRHGDQVFNPIAISVNESGQSDDHILTGWNETGTRVVLLEMRRKISNSKFEMIQSYFGGNGK